MNVGMELLTRAWARQQRLHHVRKQPSPSEAVNCLISSARGAKVFFNTDCCFSLFFCSYNEVSEGRSFFKKMVHLGHSCRCTKALLSGLFFERFWQQGSSGHLQEEALGCERKQKKTMGRNSFLQKEFILLNLPLDTDETNPRFRGNRPHINPARVQEELREPIACV